ncbi:Hypothetical predicted protein [Xyrichtys novacula]|uniref:Uncharacterized protein n=1 Tax=Xyrichtys novacula TaxID=13765 RepID=A0AAV1GRL4_XYRNO|nr:Hypothetical predicted protein [Xyrichtys novacula]
MGRSSRQRGSTVRLSPFMTRPTAVPGVPLLHAVLYRSVHTTPSYLSLEYGEKQDDRAAEFAVRPSVMRSTPGRLAYLLGAVIRGAGRLEVIALQSAPLANGQMKREFEKCCNRGNPIFRAPVCSSGRLCKKRSGEREKEKQGGD